MPATIGSIRAFRTSGAVRCQPRARKQLRVCATSDMERPARPVLRPNGPPPMAPPRAPAQTPPPTPGNSTEAPPRDAPRQAGRGNFGGPGRGFSSGRGRGFDSRQSGGRGRGDRGRGDSDDDSGLVLNEAIRHDEVRVLDKMKQMVGIMSLSEALTMAKAAAADVILLNESADPPLVRICALSKYRYEQEKAKKDQSKKQREAQQTLKELKMTPRTDVHDFEVKVRQAHNFLSKGDKVKVMIEFKGREVYGMKETAIEMVEKLIVQLESVGNVENRPDMSGNTMFVLLTPKK